MNLQQDVWIRNEGRWHCSIIHTSSLKHLDCSAASWPRIDWSSYTLTIKIIRHFNAGFVMLWLSRLIHSSSKEAHT